MFLVLEIQDTGNHVSTLSYEFDNYEDAGAKYHTILSGAAKSNVLYHGAALAENGQFKFFDSYIHKVEE